jgi:fatty acid desaturase
MIYLIPAVVLLFIGWLVKYKKITWLISGYNTLSKEKKEQYDIEKLTRLIGNYILILAAIFISMAAAAVIAGKYIEIITYIGFGVLTVAIIIGLVYLNTGDRVKKTGKE